MQKLQSLWRCADLRLGARNLARFLLDRGRLLRLGRAAATALLDARRLELVLVGSECAVDREVIVRRMRRLDVFLSLVGIAQLLRRRPASAERLGQAGLTAARFDVRFVLTVDAVLRKRDHLKPRQRDLVT